MAPPCLRQRLLLQPVIPVIYIAEHRAKAVLHMGNPVFQVIAKGQRPGLLPLALADDLYDIPGRIIGNRYRPVYAVPLIQNPFRAQPVAAVVFPENMVAFRGHDFRAVPILIILIGCNRISRLPGNLRQSAVQLFFYLCQPPCPVIPVVLNLLHVL